MEIEEYEQRHEIMEAIDAEIAAGRMVEYEEDGEIMLALTDAGRAYAEEHGLGEDA